jgi:phosphoribosyl-ATP pyrophosphohydrolase/phosphoribosyl-AMP cyclohydrolase
MNLDFKKTNGLIPAIIQDNITLQVLMTGYMNEEAYTKTREEGRVTFYSRSKNRLWTKGETSGNFLDVVSIVTDCDNDALLIKVLPTGPVCHTGTQSCFGEEASAKGFLYKLEDIIDKRITEQSESSYTVSLFKKGINKMAQKVGEEAVELVIEAKDNDINLFKNEAADLFYHLLVLFRAKNVTLQDLEEVLKSRM